MSEEEGAALSKSKYAAHRGVSPAMVSYWAKTGRLVMVGALVDVAKTDAILATSVDTSRGRSPGRGGAATGVTETSMSRATARDREASADLKSLRLAREAGRLVNRDDFERTTEAVFAGLRDSLLGIPPKVADELAAQPDSRRCMEIVRDAITATLNDRADLEDALAERASATSQ